MASVKFQNKKEPVNDLGCGYCDAELIVSNVSKLTAEGGLEFERECIHRKACERAYKRGKQAQEATL